MKRDNRRKRAADTESESPPDLVVEPKTQGSNNEEDKGTTTSTTCIAQDQGQSPLPLGSHATLQRPMGKPGDRFIPLVLAKVAKYISGDSLFITIPRIVTQAESRSPIYKVCNAIGLAYVTSKTQGPTADATKARGYRCALAAVNAALQDPRRQTLDSTLLAVWLFGVYEVIIYLFSS
jgi:hypothetical protein